MIRSRTVLSAGLLISLVVVPAVGVNIETVPVGNPGNAADNEVMSTDLTSGYGAVAYRYRIGKYEVTAGQYSEFLNAVANTDTYGLYSTEMWSNSMGCRIQRSGTSGSYIYSVASDYANRPVNFVSYWDACRFTNWLHNGQPTGAQAAGTTETGAYTLNGYNDLDGATIQRNAGWKWAVPSEDEWYKAAYHKNDGVTGNYFDYPTSSNSIPGRDLNDASGNNANYYGDPFPIESPYYTTMVGEFQNSDSPYGTFDQGGNLWELNEAIMYPGATTYTERVARGGGFYYEDFRLRASHRNNVNYPTYEGPSVGFRVSEIPEPTSIVLLAFGGVGMLVRRTGWKGSRG